MNGRGRKKWVVAVAVGEGAVIVIELVLGCENRIKWNAKPIVAAGSTLGNDNAARNAASKTGD